MNGPNKSHQRLSRFYAFQIYKFISHFRQAIKESMPKEEQGKTVGYFTQVLS